MEEEKDKPLKYAFRLLSIRLRSNKELKERLKRKFPDEEIEKTMDKLKKWGYINDKEFANAWIKDRLKNNPKGKFLLIRELQKKGIESEIIENVLQKLYPSEKEKELAEKIALKKWDKDRKIEEKKRKERLYRYLLSRGFPINLVNDILRKLKT